MSASPKEEDSQIKAEVGVLKQNKHFSENIDIFNHTFYSTPSHMYTYQRDRSMCPWPKGSWCFILVQFILFCFVVQLLSCVQLFAIPRTTAHQAPLSFTISLSLLKLMSTESMMSANYLILCRPLSLLPSMFPASESFLKNQLFTSGGSKPLERNV